MSHKKKKKQLHSHVFAILIGLLCLASGILIGLWSYFESLYKGKVYPNIYMNGIAFGGQTPEQVKNYWLTSSKPFSDTLFTFTSDVLIATYSGQQLSVEYDATLSAQQAYVVGRSNHLLSNIFQKFFLGPIYLTPAIIWDQDALTSIIASFSASLNKPSKDALFQFSNGKVAAFQLSEKGQQVNGDQLRIWFLQAVNQLSTRDSMEITIPIPIDVVEPKVTTESVNTFGIKERIGRGHSVFYGSIPGRVHNVALAASKFNGVLIAPGETFSFNKVVGDISAATGYQSAYIIKDGRTVMGDGGGVCQVSSTMFRAAMDAGLPILERHEHSYRVHYYEDGGYKAGLDATVFDPSYDLKFKNDTPAYILIQTKMDIPNMTLVFELYGTSDGRKSEILNHQVWGETPPPAPLYQDDPTLPVGVVKQVDFAAWGAKASFDYQVTRNNEVINKQTFSSNFRPWQAVFLKGTKQ